MGESYFNPTTALPDPQQYNVGLAGGGSVPSVFSNQAAATREQTMAPFLQRSNEADTMALKKQRIETEEFSGEDATLLRKLQRKAEAEKQKTTIENEPLDRTLKKLRAEKDIARVDLEDEDKRTALANKILDNKAHPRIQFMGSMAAIYKDLKDEKDPTKKMGIYENAVKNFEATYGPLEQHGLSEFKHYSEAPAVQKQMDMMHSTMVHTAAHQQAEELEAQKGEQALTQERERTRGAQAVEAQREKGAMARQQQAQDVGKNTEQRVLSLRRQLADPKLAPEKRQALEDERNVVERSLVEKQLSDEVSKPDATLMGTKFGQQALKTYTEHRDTRRVELLADRGIAPSLNEIRRATGVGSNVPDDKIKQIWNKNHPNAAIR
jgi:hypothetical protein